MWHMLTQGGHIFSFDKTYGQKLDKLSNKTKLFIY